jgi:hypothetical protein
MHATIFAAPSQPHSRDRAKRLLCLAALAVLAILAVAPAAHAVTVVGTDGGPMLDPFQRWADRSAMPTAPGTVTVDLNSSMCGESAACTTAFPPTIWFGSAADRGDFLHELGHQFDYNVMTDAARASFMRIAGLSGPWRSTNPNPAYERFAEAYRMCARDPRRPDDSRMGYLYEPTVREHRRACALIERVGKRPAASGTSKSKSTFGSRAGRPLLMR